MKTIIFLLLLAVVAQAQITLQHQVLSVYPPQNATSVPIHDSLVVQFAPELNILPQSLSDTTFVIEASQSGWHRGVVTYDPQTHAATIKPVKPFFVGELVTAVATTSIQYDSAGTVKNLKGFAWQFWGKVSAKSYGTMRFKENLNVKGLNTLNGVSDIDMDGNMDFGSLTDAGDWLFLGKGDGLNFERDSLPQSGQMYAFNFLH